MTVAEEAVARTADEFSDLWRRFFGVSSVPPAQPTVDFDTLQVVGVFFGSRPDGCYMDAVSIARIRQTADRLRVSYREELPKSGLCTQAVVDPGHLVSTPKTDLRVEFVAD